MRFSTGASAGNIRLAAVSRPRNLYAFGREANRIMSRYDQDQDLYDCDDDKRFYEKTAYNEEYI